MTGQVLVAVAGRAVGPQPNRPASRASHPPAKHVARPVRAALEVIWWLGHGRKKKVCARLDCSHSPVPSEARGRTPVAGGRVRIMPRGRATGRVCWRGGRRGIEPGRAAHKPARPAPLRSRRRPGLRPGLARQRSRRPAATMAAGLGRAVAAVEAVDVGSCSCLSSHCPRLFDRHQRAAPGVSIDGHQPGSFEGDQPVPASLG